ncbi:LOW QUALITY PROTEIN: uncharacterized protein ACOB8E_023766 [Sarcophilus harrisii]
MFSNEEKFGAVFAIQVIIGVLKNSLLLYFYMFSFICHHKENPYENLLILTKGVPQTVKLLGIKLFFGDVACKTIVYFIYAINTLNILLWKILYDSVWFGLTICSNFYIIFILQKHHHQVFWIYNTCFSPRTSPEFGSTNIVMMLMKSFICFCLVSTIFFHLYKSSQTSTLWIYISLPLSLDVFQPSTPLCSTVASASSPGPDFFFK